MDFNIASRKNSDIVFILIIQCCGSVGFFTFTGVDFTTYRYFITRNIEAMIYINGAIIVRRHLIACVAELYLSRICNLKRIKCFSLTNITFQVYIAAASVDY